MKQQLSEIDSLAKAGHVAEAMKLCDTLIQANPKVAELYEKRGALYSKAGDFRRAIEDIETVMTLVPDSAAPHFRKGRYLMSSARYKEASESFASADSLDSGYFGDAVHFYRAEALLRSKDYLGALRACAQIKTNYSERYFFGYEHRSKQDIEAEARAGLKRQQ